MISRTFRSLALPVRVPLYRCYATTSFAKNIPTVELAFDKHASATRNTNEPILFLHGLFGSKANNRSVSKYEHLYHCAIDQMLTVFLTEFWPKT